MQSPVAYTRVTSLRPTFTLDGTTEFSRTLVLTIPEETQFMSTGCMLYALGGFKLPLTDTETSNPASCLFKQAGYPE